MFNFVFKNNKINFLAFLFYMLKNIYHILFIYLKNG